MGIRLLDPDLSGLHAIREGHLHRLAYRDLNGFGIGRVTGVGAVLRDDFLDCVGSGKKMVGKNSTIFPGSEDSHQLMIAVIDFKFPTSSAAAIRHGLDDLPPALVRIGKSHRRRTIGCDRDRFHGSIIDPVRIVAGFLPSVVSTGCQTRGGDRSIRTCGKGRAGDRACAGGIRVQSAFCCDSSSDGSM